jgi:Mg-chelatase subunit ChlD
MKKIFNLIIVDESGSMSVIQKQALSGLNETLHTVRLLAKQHTELEQNVTLLFFDSNHRNYKYFNTSANDTVELTDKDYSPCGCTPLYDTIGEAVGKVNALMGSGDEALVTIITDGYENASTEFTLQMVKNLIEKLKEQGWTFTLIGTDNLDVEGMAKSMAIEDHMAFTEDAAGTEAMFAKERASRICFTGSVASGAERKRGSFFKK